MKQICLIIFFSIFMTCLGAKACGPDLPYSYIENNGDLSFPSLSFPSELIRIAESMFPAGQAADFKDSLTVATEADVADFMEMMQSPEMEALIDSDEERDSIVCDYGEYAEACRSGIELDFIPPPEIKEHVKEFMLYLDGVKELVGKKDTSEIPEAWRHLLSLPPEKRKFRTAWVVYTMGNLHSRAERSREAHQEYANLRKLVAEGFRDSQGLAFGSYKRDYACESSLVDKIAYGLKAIAFYTSRKNETGDKICEFLISDIYYIVSFSLSPDSVLEDMFRDEACMQVVLAIMLDQVVFGTYARQGRQGKILELMKDRKTAQGDIFAFAAFRFGDIPMTEKWLKVTPDDSMLGIWIRAELARRANRYDEATMLYRKWLALFKTARENGQISKVSSIRFLTNQTYSYNNAEFDEEIYGQLGTTSIHRRDFMEALHCFMMAKSWPDASYIAESVLDLDELKGYVDAYEGKEKLFLRNKEELVETLPENDCGELNIYHDLRYLLARRILRGNNYDEALRYMPEKLKDKTLRLKAFVVKSGTPALDADTRALALYNAAKIMRWYGMALVGTENAPDSGSFDGGYEYSVSPSKAMPSDLQALEEANMPDKVLRFHYRYIAADMMWKAADMASDKNLKSLAYYVGGRYIEARSPFIADPFYKKLVILGNGPLSQKADQKRWFPKFFSNPLEKEAAGSEAVPDLDAVKKILESKEEFKEEIKNDEQ